MSADMLPLPIPAPQPRLAYERRAYSREYHEELMDLYTHVLRNGRAVFGDSFLQLGTLRAFEQFVFKNSFPGAK
jgi:hypothetical protein